MITRTITRFALLVATVALLAVTASSQVKNHSLPGGVQALKPIDQVKVFLLTDRMAGSLRDSLVIDVGIRNDGPEEIYVFGRIAWGPGGGLVLRIRNHDGVEIAPIVRDDTLFPPPGSHDLSAFVHLDVGDFLGTRREVPLKDLVSAPGKYTLQIEYRSQAPRRFFDQKLQRLPALWHEDPSILSNSVSFEVSP